MLLLHMKHLLPLSPPELLLLLLLLLLDDILVTFGRRKRVPGDVSAHLEQSRMNDRMKTNQKTQKTFERVEADFCSVASGGGGSSGSRAENEG